MKVKFEHKLTKQEITNNAQRWEKLLNKNSDLRIIKDGCIESVTIDYYDSFILDTLRKMGKSKISQLVGKLMGYINLQDTMYVYLINRLIESGKIKITLDNIIRYFENFVEIVV